MRIPRFQVNSFSMVENVWKYDSFGTKLFQLQMPKMGFAFCEGWKKKYGKETIDNKPNIGSKILNPW